MWGGASALLFSLIFDLINHTHTHTHRYMSFSARKMVMSPVRKIKNGIRIKRNEYHWRSWNISPVFLPALEFWGQRCFIPCICIFLIFVGQNYQAELATAAAATGKNQAKTVCLLTLRSRERRAKRSYMRGGSGSSLMCIWYDDSKDGTCLQLDLHLLISLSIDLALQPTYINICAGTHIYVSSSRSDDEDDGNYGDEGAGANADKWQHLLLQFLFPFLSSDRQRWRDRMTPYIEARKRNWFLTIFIGVFPVAGLVLSQWLGSLILPFEGFNFHFKSVGSRLRRLRRLWWWRAGAIPFDGHVIMSIEHVKYDAVIQCQGATSAVPSCPSSWSHHRHHPHARRCKALWFFFPSCRI